MKEHWSVWLFLIALTAVVPALAQTGLPNGWFPAGSRPTDYDMAVDPSGGRSGGAAFIRAKTPSVDPSGFATVMQNFSADVYLGKRLRLTGYVKTSDITGWVGLWMRVDGVDPKVPLTFDNMQGRPIRGSQAWTKCEIVLDVPSTAKNIAFGMLQAGPGQSWMDDLSFDVVDTAVPTTNILNRGTPPVQSQPSSLNFDRR